MTNSTSSHRIEVVDALRGFALMAIMLLHNIEKFDLYFFPENLPTLVKTTGTGIWHTLFFLFGGKAYAIFSLLFGLSFFIQMNNQEKLGQDFRLRFMWRLFILFLIGMVNSCFFQGDILTIYAILGLSLLLVVKWPDRVVFILAVILLLQPFIVGKFFYLLLHPDYIPTANKSDFYFGQIGEYLMGNSFTALVEGNQTTGKLAVYWWSWENGRFFQAAALFMLGMLLGRRGKFIATEDNIRFWSKTWILALACFIPLFLLKTYLPELLHSEKLVNQLQPALASWSNFAFMLVLVSGFIWLYQKEAFHRMLSLLVPFGKMSLTNYCVQSIVGTFLYYGYGLALYQYMGPTYSFLLGIVLFLLQAAFSTWWLKTHKQGPLERLWYKATWAFSGKQ